MIEAIREGVRYGLIIFGGAIGFIVPVIIIGLIGNVIRGFAQGISKRRNEK